MGRLTLALRVVVGDPDVHRRPRGTLVVRQQVVIELECIEIDRLEGAPYPLPPGELQRKFAERGTHRTQLDALGQGEAERCSRSGCGPRRLSKAARPSSISVQIMNTTQPSNQWSTPSAMRGPECSTVMPITPMRRLFMNTAIGML